MLELYVNEYTNEISSNYFEVVYNEYTTDFFTNYNKLENDGYTANKDDNGKYYFEMFYIPWCVNIKFLFSKYIYGNYGLESILFESEKKNMKLYITI